MSKKEERKGKFDLTRRDVLKIPAVALGAMACGSSLSSCGSSTSSAIAGGGDPANRNTLFASLPVFPLMEPLDPNEIRVTFLGTSCVPRLSQECNSVFVEVGNARGQADQFVFDCGTGVVAKYQAMGIPFSKMDKIFFTHLHGDHTSDLIHIYCFGPSTDRKKPLYIFGPKDSGFVYNIPGGGTRGPFSDGTKAFCQSFRDTMRWHSESFSFGYTRDGNTTVKTRADWGTPIGFPVQVGDDNPTDGYALYATELDWTLNPGVAYSNPTSGVVITHFPAIHCRRGSISYKLTWNGMSLIFTGDTKPNNNILAQAPGVDLLIHEMVVPASVWAAKNSGYTSGPIYEEALNYAQQVQDSSHTPQGAFGYLLSQLNPRPRLTVATHFQAEDDTIASATQSVRNHTLTGDLTFAADLMVINVSRTQIRQRRAVVSDYAFFPPANVSQPYSALQVPIYHNPDGTMNPTAQLDLSDQTERVDPVTHAERWRYDGY